MQGDLVVSGPPVKPGEFQNHWRALIGCTLAAAVGTIGLNAYSQGAFVPTLVAQVGYTREQLSLATLVLSATIALLAPLVGALLDRWGAVPIIAACVVGEAMGFAFLGLAPAQFHWFIGGMVLLGVLGVGTTPPSFSRVIAAHFDRRRGLALGIMIGGLGLVAISAPIVMTKVLALAGWRAGYLVLATVVLVLGGAGLWLVRLDPPALVRLATTGGPPAKRGDWSALKRPLFWYLLLCFAMPALFGGGYLLHMISILRGKGFTPAQAAEVQALIGGAVVVGRLSSGFAMDRVFAPYVAATTFAISAAGCVMLFGHSGLVLSLGALAIGLTIGAELDILAYVASRYFGLDSFGRLYSLAYSAMILAGGASPLLIAQLAPNGDYTIALAVSTIGMAAAAALVARLPRFGLLTRAELVAA
jgi:predicted MFS family arabinose efflux permease